MAASPSFEGGSFRDPQARVVEVGGAIYRVLSRQALGEWRSLASSATLERFIGSQSLVATEELPFEEGPSELRSLSGEWSGLLCHERMPFVSYPYEWCFGMLQDAALLELDILSSALEEDLTLKDASPFNVLWRGSQPVFIDVSSFERLGEGEPWFGYRQFCSMFLCPLMLQAYKEMDFHPWMRGSLDGIEPEAMAQLLRPRDLLRPGVFVHVYLQAKLHRRYSSSDTSYLESVKSSGFRKEMIAANVSRLRRLVSRLDWKARRSEWSSYTEEHSYGDEDLERKVDFVSKVLSRWPRQCVWDLGANTGVFSRIAAEHADRVVAMDSDHLSIERLYQQLKKEGERKIHPLVVDLSQPSPPLGWRSRERRSLEDRADADLVLCLALIHHLVIGCTIPVTEVVHWLRSFEAEVVLEVPHREDPMTRKLLRNKKERHDDYGREQIEAELRRKFTVTDSLQLLSGTRTLYHLVPRAG